MSVEDPAFIRSSRPDQPLLSSTIFHSLPFPLHSTPSPRISLGSPSPSSHHLSTHPLERLITPQHFSHIGTLTHLIFKLKLITNPVVVIDTALDAGTVTPLREISGGRTHCECDVKHDKVERQKKEEGRKDRRRKRWQEIGSDRSSPIYRLNRLSRENGSPLRSAVLSSFLCFLCFSPTHQQYRQYDTNKNKDEGEETT